LLLDRFDEIAHEEECGAATLISSPLDSADVQARYGKRGNVAFTDDRVGQISSLAYEDDHASRLMASLHQKTRNMVRKAEKVGVSVEIRNDMMSFLRDVHASNMSDIGGLRKSDDFFSRVPDHFVADKDFRVYVANFENKPVAALLLFYFNGTVEYFTPAVLAEFRGTQALSFIIFSAMCDASKWGFRRWNWGGTWLSQDGVYRFKKRWAAQDFPYRYFVSVYDQALLENAPEEFLRRYPNFYVVPFSALQETV
jgi:lipid II:glycine glycyltransferase (peptidoglycan interpeptide bridge formation enzyme)